MISPGSILRTGLLASNVRPSVMVTEDMQKKRPRSCSASSTALLMLARSPALFLPIQSNAPFNCSSVGRAPSESQSPGRSRTNSTNLASEGVPSSQRSSARASRLFSESLACFLSASVMRVKSTEPEKFSLSFGEIKGSAALDTLSSLASRSSNIWKASLSSLFATNFCSLSLSRFFAVSTSLCCDFSLFSVSLNSAGTAASPPCFESRSCSTKIGRRESIELCASTCEAPAFSKISFISAGSRSLSTWSWRLSTASLKT
mmetsp:Transcript_94120/g.186598  ORF Transcript_94120/g.186598 Transcript_94120/m.186598 type:complete len:260 (-) Transcript_94120:27-806(-)